MRGMDVNLKLRAMSLEEVARELGVTKQAVFQAEQSALKKLRRRPAVFREMVELASEMAALRDRRVPFDAEAEL